MGSEKRKIKSTEKGIFTSQQVPELQPSTPGPISPRSSLMRPILLFQATPPTPSTTKKKRKTCNPAVFNLFLHMHFFLECFSSKWIPLLSMFSFGLAYKGHFSDFFYYGGPACFFTLFLQ